MSFGMRRRKSLSPEEAAESFSIDIESGKFYLSFQYHEVLVSEVKKSGIFLYSPNHMHWYAPIFRGSQKAILAMKHVPVRVKEAVAVIDVSGIDSRAAKKQIYNDQVARSAQGLYYDISPKALVRRLREAEKSKYPFGRDVLMATAKIDPVAMMEVIAAAVHLKRLSGEDRRRLQIMGDHLRAEFPVEIMAAALGITPNDLA